MAYRDRAVSRETEAELPSREDEVALEKSMAEEIEKARRQDARMASRREHERERREREAADKKARTEERQRHPETMQRDADVWRDLYSAALRGGKANPMEAAQIGLALYREVAEGLV